MLEEVPDKEYTIPIGKAEIISQGKDLTIVSYGYQILQIKKAISELQQYLIELIDLQSLNPLDLDTIISSVTKTRRLLLVQEDYQICSISEHTAFHIYSNLFLESKIKIISARYCPIPFSPPLENYVLPQVTDIINGVKGILG